MNVDLPGYEVLGIGAPLIDLIVHVDDAFLNELPGSKGGMQPVAPEAIERLLQKTGNNPVIATGGSAANTLKGLARLGHKCALLGRIGRDEAADYFLQSMYDHHIQCEFTVSSTPTGQVLSLVAPDGSRTFRSWQGASGELQPDDLIASQFTGARLVHIEGYSLQNPGVTERAMELAKCAGAKLSLDLATHELVTAHKVQLTKLLKKHVDIVFCNQDEIRALTGQDPESGCKALRELCDIAVVLLGPEGCLVGSGDVLHYSPAHTVKAIDTTGAGDLFAAGFLHGYLLGHSLEECAAWGVLLGGAVVQVIGAEIPSPSWQSLKVKGPTRIKRRGE